MLVDDPRALNDWLISYIEPLCDADPITLAKYIMALLKKNKSENDLRNTCLTQLEVFLNTETKQFVNVLFNVLNTKSYLPKVVATPFAISTEMQPGSSNNQESIKRDRSRSPGSPAVNSNSRNRHSTNPESSNKRNRSKTPEPFSNSLQEARNDLKRSKNDGNDSKENASRFKKRCRDYEEKGYCMRGDTCLFDHGVDPVVLDPNNVGSVLALSSSIAEPYNPESPELDTSTGSVRTVSSQNSFTPSPVTLYNNPKQVPPPQPPVYWPSNPSLVNQRPNHYRDNANFSKVSSHHKNLHVNPHVNRPNFSQSNNNSNFTPRPPYRPNGPDFGEENRNGFTHRSQTSTINASAASFRPSARRSQPTVTSTASNSQSDYMSRCSLEVRRIPAAQNTISNLNDHFKRFGTIVNIQLSLDSNPEASLVQFSNHQEAFNAYRSTEAVLNNRFIRVYWHNPSVTPANASSMPDTANSVSETRSITKETVQSDFNQPKDVSSKLNDKSIDDESAPNQLADVFAATQKAAYNPGLLKKQYNATPVVVPDIPKPAPPKSTPVDSIMVMKETLLKQLEVQTKRKGIIDSLVRDQTILIDKMNKCTNEKERFGIESILKSLKAKIQSLEDDFKKNTQDILSQANQPRSKAQLSKEIMDLENELHVKIMKGESVIDIHKKLSELKVQANNMGIYPVVSKPKFPKVAYGNRYENQRKLDRRTKKMIFNEIKEDDKLDLLSHLTQFVDVESIECNSNGTIVTFKSRSDAEFALPQFIGHKFKNRVTLKYAWYDEKATPDLTPSKVTAILDQAVLALNLQESVSNPQPVSAVEGDLLNHSTGAIQSGQMAEEHDDPKFEMDQLTTIDLQNAKIEPKETIDVKIKSEPIDDVSIKIESVDNVPVKSEPMPIDDSTASAAENQSEQVQM